MIVQEMALRFKEEIKRLDSTDAIDLEIPQIVSYLNRGMNSLLKNRYSPSGLPANKYRAALEAVQKRIDEWRRLIVAHEEIECKTTDNLPTLYTIDLMKCAEKYMFLLRISFKGDCEDCQNQWIRSYPATSDSIDVDLDNPDASPRFDWRETLHRFAGDNILAYTDGTFSLRKANLDYLRYPRPIDIVGYTHADGSKSADSDCELPDFLHDEIISQAVLLYKITLNHPDAPAAAQAVELTE
jgi:hypothetical protein